MRTVAITRVSLQRLLRDRRALFFMIVLPVLVILIVGATLRGFGTFRVGVVDLGAGPAGRHLTAQLEQAPDIVVVHYASVDAAATAVARTEVNTAVLLPAGMDADLRSGRSVKVAVIAEQSNTTQQAAVTAVAAVVAKEGGRVQAATFTRQQGAGTFDGNLALAGSLEHQVATVSAESHVADSSAAILPEGFSYSAPTMLVLFVFLNALAGGATVIETRRLGMYQRMMAAPVRARTIIAGETLSFATIALLQSVLIVGIGALLFGVSWGNPLAAVTLIVVWALVGAGAGMLAGTLFRTPEQATAIGPAVGFALAMLGGCMWPLAIVSGFMRQIGHVTPHAWAVDAWTDLLARGGDLASIAEALFVLVGFAAGFLALATVRMRRVIS